MVKVRKPSLLGVLLRVLFMTFLVTLFTFAVTLMCSIFALLIVGEVRGGVSHVNMTAAYRHIAFPAAVIVGAVGLVVALIYEMRRYFQMRTLARLEEKL